MQVNKSGLFWGLLLVIGGVFALAQQLGYIDELSPEVGMYAFAAISVLALVMYATSGWQDWGWLFPAGIFGGLAVTVALAINGFDNAAIGSPLFFGLLIPFVAAYLTDRVHNWWALIPGGIMLFLALMMLAVDTAGGEWVGSILLFMIGLSFLIVYLTNRTRTWALLVAYIMGVLSLAPAMASFEDNIAAYYGAVILFAIAVPFFVVYFRSAENWWAIIPAGVLTTIAIVTALGISGWIHDEKTGGFSNAIMMGGLAATFAVIWLRHARPWAKIVAIVLAALAVASVFFASFSEMIWPLAIIAVGAYLLYIGLRRKPSS